MGRKNPQIGAWNFSAEHFPGQSKSIAAGTGTQAIFPTQYPPDRPGQQAQRQDPVASFGIQASSQKSYGLRAGTSHPDMFRLKIDIVAVEGIAEQSPVFQESL